MKAYCYEMAECHTNIRPKTTENRSVPTAQTVHYIDRVGRIIVPLTYILFNVGYFTFFLSSANDHKQVHSNSWLGSKYFSQLPNFNVTPLSAYEAWKRVFSSYIGLGRNWRLVIYRYRITWYKNHESSAGLYRGKCRRFGEVCIYQTLHHIKGITFDNIVREGRI